jgi:hypothetical protein
MYKRRGLVLHTLSCYTSSCQGQALHIAIDVSLNPVLSNSPRPNHLINLSDTEIPVCQMISTALS